MPLPPLLLERLKRKGLIKEAQSEEGAPQPPPSTGGGGGSRTKAPASEYAYQDTSGPSVVNELIGPGNNQEELEEEIIAEDYSDEGGEEQQQHLGASAEDAGANDCDRRGKELVACQGGESLDGENTGALQQAARRWQSVLGCPNKYNVYHECSQYCEDNYSRPETMEPTMEQRKQLAMLLRTYPMSNEWTVVYDPGVRTFYFWNIITNLVSWFPPAMEGFVSLPADQMRRSMLEMGAI